MNTNLDFLFDIEPDGEYLYNCTELAFELYRNEYYEIVPNAVRMFYECLFILFFGGYQSIQKDDFGNPRIKEAVDNYFRKYTASQEDRNFYYQIFLEDWRNSNIGSHYTNIENNTINRLIENAKELLYGVSNACCWYYTKKTGKTINLNVNEMLKKRKVADSCSEEIIEKIKEKDDIINGLQTEIDNYKKLFNDKVKNQSEKLKIALDTIKQLEKLHSKQILGKNLRIKQLEEKVEKLNGKNVPPKVDTKTITSHVDNKVGNSKFNKFAISNILEVIYYMNKCGAYATINTIFNLFKGVENTPIMSYYPALKQCKQFGSNKNLKIDNLEIYIDFLLAQNLIVKEGAAYKVLIKEGG